MTKAGIFTLLALTLSYAFPLYSDCMVYLGSSNFTQLVDHSPKMWLLLFVDPDCVHCKHVDSAWQHASRELCHDPEFAMGVIDLKANKELEYRFEIKGPLSILLIKDKVVYSLEEFPDKDISRFAYNADIVLKGRPVPSSKNFFSKLWYVTCLAAEKGLILFKYCNLFTPIKLLLLLLLLLLPLLLGAVFLYLARTVETEGKYDENVRPESVESKKAGRKGRGEREGSMYTKRSVLAGEEYGPESSLEVYDE
eukprot:TRINITY_DN1532_c0_g2_i23.p1 TRINITY_DN1532_c0_g2~~TRINITY_DN1532_c0_g2_i23.p1  ORF type:complete len:252 (-),score=57.29 TRINITY_DN1532_c0_g2_i23:132-887(-)